MACPKKWKHCLDIGSWDDPLHKVFNGASKNYKKFMGIK